MPKSLLLTLAAALALAVSGCATTGDPKAGGLFGWSESKAQQRQAASRAALAQEEQRGAQLRAERQRLQSQISAKQRQMSNLEKSRASSAPTPAEEAEYRRLKREIEELNEQSLVLMDL